MEYTMQVYNDKSIKALICCVCACVRVDTGGVRSQIEFMSGNWFFNLPRGSLKKQLFYEYFYAAVSATQQSTCIRWQVT